MNIQTSSILLTLLFLSMFNSNSVKAQTTFTAHSFEEGITSPSGLYSADIDMDGDIDVVAGSGENGVAWWENEGGDPVTWTRRMVDPNIGVCLTVFVADIIHDGQPDIIAASTDKNQIIYYKNNGGDPIVWSKYTISTDMDEPHEIYACDFDLDGNQDVFAACMGSNEISWWHNDGGDPATWTKQVISSDEIGARSVHVGDIDGDGDNDVVGATFDTDEIIWWRNDGGYPVNWSEQIVTNTFDGSHRVQIADIDNDGDSDIIGTGYMAASIIVWTNDNGLGTQWTEVPVDVSFAGAVIGYVVDINSDGYFDILGTAQASNQVAWYMNKGGETLDFKKYQLSDNFDGVWPAHAGDYDNDLDMDLLVGGFDANEVRWYENKQVGRFTNKITFDQVPTNLGFFVPEDYNPNQAYKLIVGLHICGDENEYSRYRDNLIELCLELNAILVAPDCHNTINNLDIPDAAIILGATDYAIGRFNIDEEFVYLTGGSCNGRTTLKYGLEEIYPFRGVIPFNPYLPDWTEDYYDFTSDMPVCFASGTTDPNYTNCQEAYNLLMQNQAKAGFVSMQGIAHEFYFPEFTDVMIECINFVDSIAESTTGIHHPGLVQNKINVFPNPFNDNLNIQLSENLHGEVNISISNMVGQVVYQKNHNVRPHSRELIQLNLSELKLPNSILILQVGNNNNALRKRIIKN